MEIKSVVLSGTSTIIITFKNDYYREHDSNKLLKIGPLKNKFAKFFFLKKVIF